MASNDLKLSAEARLEQAARGAGCADPRPPLRDLLRELKETRSGAFERARSHYQEAVLPALAGGEDPLTAWVDYARYLAELTAAGRLLAVDPSGRASPYQAPESGLLVIFLPDEGAARVVPVLSPETPSAAQQATLDLLVHRKLSL